MPKHSKDYIHDCAYINKVTFNDDTVAIKIKNSGSVTYKELMDQMSRAIVSDMVHYFHGNQTDAANKLEINRGTLRKYSTPKP